MQNPEMSICAICLGTLEPDRSQALFTGECSHTFHFQCIASSVQHGNCVCPLCMAQWKELPFAAPPSPGRRRVPFAPQQHPAPFYPASEPRVFNDDEAVELSRPAGHRRIGSGTGTVEIRTHPEFASFPRSLVKEDFAVLVHLKAPSTAGLEPSAAASRAPLDLVTLLDVSGSMAGAKLRLLKQAMEFVIQNLGPADRLSVVSFSSSARRLFPLCRMSDAGRQQALRGINSLTAGGGTHIAEALRKGAKVLEERRHRNPVSSIILLSDGQDTYTVFRRSNSQIANHELLIPQSILMHAEGQRLPIHTFGFGADHDAAALHAISEASGGTFSFIEDQGSIQDAFAQCLGGLLSVVVQEMRVGVECVHPGVRLTSIKSGRYESCVTADNRSGSIDVGDLYADEERRFLALVNLPPTTDDDDDDETKLLTVSCTYRDTGTMSAVDLGRQEVVVQRPEQVPDQQVSIEVDRERVRIQTTEDMAAARAAAELGDYFGAVGILDNRRQTNVNSTAARSGDEMCSVLDEELQEMGSMVENRQRYESVGRAFVLAGLSSHTNQRATARASMSADIIARQPGSSSGYQTPFMASMVRKSQHSRTFRGPPQSR